MEKLYFAYGPNMSRETVRQKIPEIKFLKRAFLENHKFVYEGIKDSLKRKSFANVVEKTGSIVWGALYEITEQDITVLDELEGFPLYDRKTFIVADDSGVKHEAITYCKKARFPSAPSKEYRQVVVNGAKECNLPEEYILKISYLTNC